MRKALIVFAIFGFALGAKNLPRDVEGFLRQGKLQPVKITKGWYFSDRAPLDLIESAVRATYGRGIEKIWPISAVDGSLVAYGIDLEEVSMEGEVHGIPPVKSIIISASLTSQPFIGEFPIRFEGLLSCLFSQKVVLSQGLGVFSYCGGKWMIGHRVVSRAQLEKWGERPVLKNKPVAKLPRSWVSFLRGKAGKNSSKVLVFPEYDLVYPIDHHMTWGIPGILDPGL